jgi:hypothetical protein
MEDIYTIVYTTTSKSIARLGMIVTPEANDNNIIQALEDWQISAASDLEYEDWQHSL